MQQKQCIYPTASCCCNEDIGVFNLHCPMYAITSVFCRDMSIAHLVTNQHKIFLYPLSNLHYKHGLIVHYSSAENSHISLQKIKYAWDVNLLTKKSLKSLTDISVLPLLVSKFYKDILAIPAESFWGCLYHFYNKLLSP